jgi:hypothetical protein
MGIDGVELDASNADQTLPPEIKPLADFICANSLTRRDVHKFLKIAEVILK